MKRKFSCISVSALLVTGILSASIVAPAYAKAGGQGQGQASGGQGQASGGQGQASGGQGQASGGQGQTSGGQGQTSGGQGQASGGQGQTSGSQGQTSGGQTSSAICRITDISLGGVSATACDGPNAGNDTGAVGTLLSKLNDDGLFSSFVGTGVQWSLAGKSDNANPFAITADNGSSSGAFNFGSALSSNTFVVSLKAGNGYSAYLFKDYDFSQGLTGIFNTIGVALDGSGNAGKALSHASLFVSNIKINTPPPRTYVPEPASLLGLGLLATGMIKVRRRRSI